MCAELGLPFLSVPTAPTVQPTAPILRPTAPTSPRPPVPRVPPVPAPTCAALLEAEALEDLLELGVLAELGQADVDAPPQPRPQVGGTGQDVAQVLRPHEGVARLLEDLLDLGGGRHNKKAQRYKPEQDPNQGALLVSASSTSL